MKLAEFRENIRELRFQEVRTDSQGYFEAVISKEELPLLIIELEEAFGRPAYPSKKGLPRDTLDIINECGGIRHGQTLYFKHAAAYSLFVMLWPWSDGEHITLKIGQQG